MHEIKEYKEKIKLWGLEELLEIKWKKLSFGQRKRVFLSFSLLKSIPVWVINEPSNGLNAIWVDRLIDLINSHRNTNLVLFSSHDNLFLHCIRQWKLCTCDFKQCRRMSFFLVFPDQRKWV